MGVGVGVGAGVGVGVGVVGAGVPLPVPESPVDPPEEQATRRAETATAEIRRNRYIAQD